jgi:hypothetical protein
MLCRYQVIILSLFSGSMFGNRPVTLNKQINKGGYELQCIIAGDVAVLMLISVKKQLLCLLKNVLSF